MHSNKKIQATTREGKSEQNQRLMSGKQHSRDDRISLTIPKEIHHSINLARKTVHLNLRNIPLRIKKWLIDKNCPICNTEMDMMEKMFSEVKMFYKCPKCSFCKPVLDVEKIIDIRNSASSEEIEAITSPITIIGIGTYKVLEEFQKKQDSGEIRKKYLVPSEGS